MTEREPTPGSTPAQDRAATQTPAPATSQRRTRSMAPETPQEANVPSMPSPADVPLPPSDDTMYLMSPASSAGSDGMGPYSNNELVDVSDAETSARSTRVDDDDMETPRAQTGGGKYHPGQTRRTPFGASKKSNIAEAEGSADEEEFEDMDKTMYIFDDRPAGALAPLPVQTPARSFLNNPLERLRNLTPSITRTPQLENYPLPQRTPNLFLGESNAGDLQLAQNVDDLAALVSAKDLQIQALEEQLAVARSGPIEQFVDLSPEKKNAPMPRTVKRTRSPVKRARRSPNKKYPQTVQRIGPTRLDPGIFSPAFRPLFPATERKARPQETQDLKAFSTTELPQASPSQDPNARSGSAPPEPSVPSFRHAEIEFLHATINGHKAGNQRLIERITELETDHAGALARKDREIEELQRQLAEKETVLESTNQTLIGERRARIKGQKTVRFLHDEKKFAERAAACSTCKDGEAQDGKVPLPSSPARSSAPPSSAPVSPTASVVSTASRRPVHQLRTLGTRSNTAPAPAPVPTQKAGTKRGTRDEEEASGRPQKRALAGINTGNIMLGSTTAKGREEGKMGKEEGLKKAPLRRAFRSAAATARADPAIGGRGVPGRRPARG